jgi:hypothetical protein
MRMRFMSDRNDFSPLPVTPNTLLILANMVNRVYTVVYGFSYCIFTLPLPPDGGEGEGREKSRA